GEISKLGARVFSMKASEALNARLKLITDYELSVGWLLMEYEGIIIDSNFPEYTDVDSMAALTYSIYMCTEHAMRFLQYEINHILLKTAIGHCIISDFSGSLLLVLTRGTTDGVAARLLDTILSVN
ncbi:MAG: hypothetical protein K2Z81_03480, partial [Cyanobacteria bacterium]|nr:hypothetical protein [Cyanobacteriota bacterium]